MSRIPSTADRPIPTSEPTVATQQTSETESVKNTDITGKAPIEAEQVAKEPASTTDSKGAQYESRLGGLARESEMQSQFPIPSSPTLKEYPELRPNLDPNVHLDEKIDLTKNLPDGMAINKGLDGLDWGPNKAKTGPGHFDVEMTRGGMKAPTDVLAEVRSGGKPSQPNTSGPPKDTRRTMTTADKSAGGGGVQGFEGKNHGPNSPPPPGVEVSFRNPKWDQVGQSRGDTYKVSPESQAKMDAMAKAEQAARQKRADDKEAKARFEKRQYEPKDDYVDPDAGGGAGIPSADDIERIAKVHLGSRGHAVNPDLGLGDGPKTAGEFKKPIDPLRDPSEEESVQLLSPEQAKLNADIHGPRTVNPNSDGGPGKNIPVVPPQGGDTGNPEGWKP